MEMEVDDHILICVRMGLRQKLTLARCLSSQQIFDLFKDIEHLASPEYSVSEHCSQVVL